MRDRLPSPPFFRHLEVGEEDNLPAAQYLHGLAVETPVHPSGGKPNEVGDEMGGDKRLLLALDNGYGLGGHGGGGVRQQVLAEQALLHKELLMKVLTPEYCKELLNKTKTLQLWIKGRL